MPVTETGSKEVAKFLKAMGRNAVHAKPAMAEITLLLLAGETALWKRHGGKKWPPRADGTDAGVLTGTLEKSLTEPASEGAIREIHDDHLLFGTSLWYSRFMQGTKHQPARPILIFRPTDRKKTKTIIQKQILGELPGGKRR